MLVKGKQLQNILNLSRDGFTNIAIGENLPYAEDSDKGIMEYTYDLRAVYLWMSKSPKATRTRYATILRKYMGDGIGEVRISVRDLFLEDGYMDIQVDTSDITQVAKVAQAVKDISMGQSKITENKKMAGDLIETSVVNEFLELVLKLVTTHFGDSFALEVAETPKRTSIIVEEKLEKIIESINLFIVQQGIAE